MRILKPTRIQWITLLFPLPFVILLMYYFVNADKGMHWGDFLQMTMMSMPFASCSWYTCVVINNFVTVHKPLLSHTLQRIVLLALIHTAWVCCLMYLLYFVLGTVPGSGETLQPEDFATSVIVALVFNVVFCIIWQVEYIFGMWKQSIGEKELAAQQFLQQEFEHLKRQINPHFLFNNLNVLSSLIAANPPRAVYFLDELSRVYRYLLRNGKDGVTTLAEELAFMRSYAALLEIRFGSAVTIRTDTPVSAVEYMVPSFCLQLLVENAIKHNIADKQRPLLITITIPEPGILQVRNNLQPRIAAVLSNGVGLANIRTKYRLLHHSNIRISSEDGYFTVSVPLINQPQQKHMYEHTDH